MSNIENLGTNPKSCSRQKNAFTVDLEDWFCSTPQGNYFSEWNKKQLRIEKTTYQILELLDRHGIKATFFVLGWIAEKAPQLIEQIDLLGHEICSHGYSHTKIYEQTRYEFNEDIKRANDILTSIINKHISGYRAPCFSITEKNPWALDILSENGFIYDSSVFPNGFHPDYGMMNTELDLYKLPNGMTEAPISSVYLLKNMFSKSFFNRIPVGGGAYFRYYPYSFTKYLIKKSNDSGRTFIFYIHPWEIDGEQPVEYRNLIYLARHYYNLNTTLTKLEALMNDFEFTTLGNVIHQWTQNHEQFNRNRREFA